MQTVCAGDPRPDPGEPARDAGEAKERLVRLTSWSGASRPAGCWSPASRPTGAGGWRRRSRASSRSRRSSASTRASRRASSSAPSSSRSRNQHSLLQRIVRAAEIDTVIDTRLIVNSLAASPRIAHENNVIGTMNILAACTGADSPVRKFIFKSSTHYYGSEQDDPAFFTEAMRRPHPPRTAARARHGRGRGGGRRVRRASSPGVKVTVLRCANVLGPDVDTGVHADVRPADGADGARLRPAASVRARGRRRPRARARGLQRRSRASTTSPPTASWRCREVDLARSASGPLPVLPPVGHGPARRRRCAGSASGSPTRC